VPTLKNKAPMSMATCGPACSCPDTPAGYRQEARDEFIRIAAFADVIRG